MRDRGMEALRPRRRELATKVAVLAEVGGGARAAALADELGLELVPSWGLAPWEFVLMSTAERLELRDNRVRRARPCYVDAARLARSQQNRSRRQPLARAIGAHTRHVIDATAGLGQDALLLASMGYEVTALERCAVLAALLRDGLARAQRDQRLKRLIAERLRVIGGEARELIPRIQPPADTIYMDPMFPPKRRRSALPPKSVRWVRELVGDDEDAVELLRVCLRFAGRRVVVKRPDDAPVLFANPALSYGTKLVRYDVYLTPSSSTRD